MGLAALSALAGPQSAPAASRGAGPGSAPAQGPTAAERERDVHRLIGLLDYLAADYAGAVSGGKVVNEEEFQEQCSLASEAVEAARELAAGMSQKDAGFLAPIESFAREVAAHAAEAQVQESARDVRKLVLSRFDARLVPDAAPNYRRGAELYAQNCALCHGADGAAETDRAQALTPRPLSFLGDKARGALSPYHAFNVSTFGVEGTSMPSYELLDEPDRWDVAFYVGSLRHPNPPAARPAGAPSFTLLEVANSSDEALAARLADLGRTAEQVPLDLAWIRHESISPDSPGSISPEAAGLRALPARARRELASALTHYREGRPDEARKVALDAYLREMEPMEATLRTLDRELVSRLEAAFVDLRAEIRRGAPEADIARRIEAIGVDLTVAETKLSASASSAFVTFLASALIILREGIEAAFLIAAILGLLRKLGRRDAAAPIHYGWVLALVAGLATWWLARTAIAISAGERELVEGIVGLVAAGMLAYTSYWILSRADAKRWLEFVRGQVTNALEGRGKATLFGIAFLAVYREAFETVLFYEALMTERGAAALPAVLLGLAAGSAVLVLAIVGIFKLSARLPVRAFFTISGALLYALAFVFAGTGIHALIEGGYLDPRPIRFPTIEWLGVYPDLLGVSLQALFVAAVGLGLAREMRARSARAAA